MSTAAHASGNVLAVNVDIDGLRFYRHIHGLPESESDNDPIWESGVPRFLELFADLDLHATFFVVASDLVPTEDGGAAPSEEEALKRQALVRAMVDAGHEVASHSFSHDYGLSQGHYGDLCADLNRARNVLESACGEEIFGFRAPGYNLSPALISAISETGYSYSSSRFPSPPYFLAKWATMAGMALMGRSSGAIKGELLAPLTSRRPYKHDSGLWELPMSVMPVTRLPAIGTFFTLYGDAGPSFLLPMLKREPWLNIEFHAFDLLDCSDMPDGDTLGEHQPDLATPAGDKRSIFLRWLRELSAGHTNKTLASVSSELTD